MLWHRQAIFESKGDKLSSSAECRIRTHQGLRHQIASRLNAHWQTDWAIEDQAKNLNSTARPYDQRAFSPLDPTSILAVLPRKRRQVPLKLPTGFRLMSEGPEDPMTVFHFRLPSFCKKVPASTFKSFLQCVLFVALHFPTSICVSPSTICLTLAISTSFPLFWEQMVLWLQMDTYTWRWRVGQHVLGWRSSVELAILKLEAVHSKFYGIVFLYPGYLY